MRLIKVLINKHMHRNIYSLRVYSVLFKFKDIIFGLECIHPSYLTIVKFSLTVYDPSYLTTVKFSEDSQNL